MSDILGERDENIPDKPTRVAEPDRKSQLPKRFYKEVSVEASGDQYRVLLDGRSIKTPGRSETLVPSQSIAELLQSEWEAQQERIDPLSMPVTRLINTAIDGVSGDMQAVKEDIIRYASSDLLCYRADAPDQLVANQTNLWDPILDWAQTDLGARLDLIEGVIHKPQPVESIAAISTHVGMIDSPFVLAGTHVITNLTSSCIIALAVLKRHLTLDDAWTAAHVDEDWNISQWGEDEEARIHREGRFRDMDAAFHVVRALS